MTGCLGQDWSSFQTGAPSTAGLTFVIIKVTEGTGYVNPEYPAQVGHARAAGLVVGHYHFARPGSMAAQLAFFLAHADIRPGDLLAFDWEDTGVSSADKDTWIKTAQRAEPAHRVVLYCNRDFWLNRDHTSFAGDGLWIADPGISAGQPRVDHAFVIHQYAETGGIDHDYSPLSPARFRAWANPQEDPAVTELTKTDVFAGAWLTDAMTPPTGAATKANPTWAPQSVLLDIANRVRAIQTAETAQTAAITALAQLIGSGVDTAAVVAAVQEAIAAAVVHVDVDVTSPTTKES